MTVPARPPFDAELEPALATVPGIFTTLEPAAIPEFRAATARPPSIEDAIAGRPVEVTDHAVAGHGGDEITVSVVRRIGHEGAASPGVWDRTSNGTGWTALLGNRRGTADVSIYAAPARATDLSDLPPAYIEVGSAKVFRDEAVAFASGIWEAGGSAELHVWAGGFHGFQTIVPTAAVSRAAVQTREAWARRRLGD